MRQFLTPICPTLEEPIDKSPSPAFFLLFQPNWQRKCKRIWAAGSEESPWQTGQNVDKKKKRKHYLQHNCTHFPPPTITLNSLMNKTTKNKTKPKNSFYPTQRGHSSHHSSAYQRVLIYHQLYTLLLLSWLINRATCHGCSTQKALTMGA